MCSSWLFHSPNFCFLVPFDPPSEKSYIRFSTRAMTLVLPLPHPRRLSFEPIHPKASPQSQYSTSLLPSPSLFCASPSCPALQPSSHVPDTTSRISSPVPSYPPRPHHPNDMPENILPFNTDPNADTPTFFDSGAHTRLAPELWSEIFSHCVSIPDWPHGCIQYEKRLLVLMQVCSHWMHILLSTATLWRWIEYHSPSSSSLEKERERIQTWLSRSRETSLYVSLTLEHRNRRVLLDDIISHSYRWESLHISCRGFSPIPLLAPAARTFRALRHVELDSLHFESAIVDDLFEGSDRLISLCLSKDHGSLPGSVALKILNGMSLPLTQLVRVHLTPPIGSAPELFTLLETLPNLVDLSVHIDAVGIPSMYDAIAKPLDIMQHEKLCSLELRVELRGGDEVISHLQKVVAEILDHLTLPCLSRFRFACPKSHWPKPDKVFCSFLARMSGSLRQLGIVEKQEVDKTRRRRVSSVAAFEEYQGYLKVAPGVQKLEVELPEYRMFDPSSLLLKDVGRLVTISQGRS